MDYAEITNKANSIERLIQNKLEQNNWIIGNLEDKSSNWTFAINRLLRDVGKEINKEYKIACKNRELGDCSEWLFDFVCYTDNEYGLCDVLFVAESEWINAWDKYRNFDHIKFDFEKLLLARCKSRIMIFEANMEEEIRKYIKRLNSIVANSKLTEANDRYFYVAWDRSNTEFIIDLYIHA